MRKAVRAAVPLAYERDACRTTALPGVDFIRMCKSDMCQIRAKDILRTAGNANFSARKV